MRKKVAGSGKISGKGLEKGFLGSGFWVWNLISGPIGLKARKGRPAEEGGEGRQKTGEGGDKRIEEEKR